MKIGGLQKLTLVDYPGKVAATVFLIGCNFRCGFCQNPELINFEERNQISESDFFDFLDEKLGLIDGICITGGEPTTNSDLINFIRKIKDKGFLVKLDTNGSNPEMLEKLIAEKLIDFVAMDIKTSLENYEKAIRVKIDLEKIKQSVKIIKNSKIDYEFRTTVVPTIVDKSDIEKIREWLGDVKKYTFQQFQNKKVLDKKFELIQPYSDEVFEDFKEIIEKYR